MTVSQGQSIEDGAFATRAACNGNFKRHTKRRKPFQRSSAPPAFLSIMPGFQILLSSPIHSLLHCITLRDSKRYLHPLDIGSFIALFSQTHRFSVYVLKGAAIVFLIFPPQAAHRWTFFGFLRFENRPALRLFSKTKLFPQFYEFR